MRGLYSILCWEYVRENIFQYITFHFGRICIKHLFTLSYTISKSEHTAQWLIHSFFFFFPPLLVHHYRRKLSKKVSYILPYLKGTTLKSSKPTENIQRLRFFVLRSSMYTAHRWSHNTKVNICRKCIVMLSNGIDCIMLLLATKRDPSCHVKNHTNKAG